MPNLEELELEKLGSELVQRKLTEAWIEAFVIGFIVGALTLAIIASLIKC